MSDCCVQLTNTKRACHEIRLTIFELYMQCFLSLFKRERAGNLYERGLE